MEQVLSVYKRAYNPLRPVVCMDETPRQLIAETRLPEAASPGVPRRYDYEYKRRGTYNIFMAREPLGGKRFTGTTQSKTKQDWARFIQKIAMEYPQAERITLVMDNLNTHAPGSLYETFAPEEAKALVDRFEWIYAPKHGSWLNMAEIEINVMIRQCLSRRIAELATAEQEIKAWENSRNTAECVINWQFSTETARIKLKRLYPTFII